GVDVQKLLPQLSVYLGHVQLASTQVYLSMTPELLAEANGRFERYAGREGGHDSSHLARSVGPALPARPPRRRAQPHCQRPPERPSILTAAPDICRPPPPAGRCRPPGPRPRHG